MFSGKLGGLGQSLPPFGGGAMACPAASTSWIVRLNPGPVRCQGPDTRLLSKEQLWCCHRSHPGRVHCNCCDRGNRAVPWWTVWVRWPVMGTARSYLRFCFFWCLCGCRVQGWVGQGDFLPPKWKRKSPTSGGVIARIMVLDVTK